MADLVEEARKLKEEFYSKLNVTSSSDDLRDLQVSYLGRKGALTSLLKTVGSLPPQERPEAGQAVNVLREELEEAIKRRRDEILSLEEEELEGPLAVVHPGILLPDPEEGVGVAQAEVPGPLVPRSPAAARWACSCPRRWRWCSS